MNLLEKIAASEFRSAHETKKVVVPGATGDNIYEVYQIPLNLLYYNDQNGRINTAYKKYKSIHGPLEPEKGNSNYNKIFEEFIYESNKQALDDTLDSIIKKGQQEAGVVLPDGRIIDGNRRFTALRKHQEKEGIEKYFNAIVVRLDSKSKVDEKSIKTLELDLQLGREEKVHYDPVDRIFDVYNTINIEKLMSIEEYRDASGAKNTRGINRDIRLAGLIERFIEIVSPGGNSIDKFYLARDLKLDGPMQEVEPTLSRLKSPNKQEIIDSTLSYMVIAKTDHVAKEPKLALRDLKNFVLNDEVNMNYFVDLSESRVDSIIDAFTDNPIQTSNDLNEVINSNLELTDEIKKFSKSVEKLTFKGATDDKRTKVLLELESIRDQLEEIRYVDFEEFNVDELFSAKDVLIEINDFIHKLRKNF